MNHLGDVITAEREHECAVCHRGISLGEPVMAAAYDALLWPRWPAAPLVWAHQPCGHLHAELTMRAPLYSTGWFRIMRPQRCASCRCELLAGDRAWRVVDSSQLVYTLMCQQCAFHTSPHIDTTEEQHGATGLERC